MKLTILLPSRVYVTVPNALSIVVETTAGSFGLLPQRMDCVAALVPGILTYTCAAQGRIYVAVDAGVLIKSAEAVIVSTRRASAGDLAALHRAVAEEFLAEDAEEQAARTAVARIQGALMSRFADFHRER